MPEDAFEQEKAAGEVPPFPARTPDVEELRKREREMHRAQMRAEAQAREEAARLERAARGEAPSEEPRPAPEPERTEPAVQQAESSPAAVRQPAETRSLPQAEAPRVDTREMLESAGLQMVETRADRVPAAPAAEEPVQLGRPRRERPRQAADEQLVQIETKQ